MTLNQLFAAAGQHPLVMLGVFLALPLGCWVLGMLHGPRSAKRSPWRYLYAVMVYAACIPGMLAAVVLLYSLFFVSQSLLDLDLLVHVLPIASMVATLLVIRSRLSFAEIPGFDRLSALMVILGVSFAVALAVQRTRIWVLFGASFLTLLVIALLTFVLLMWAWRRLVGK